MKNEKFKSYDGTVLQCYVWDEVRKPKAVVQISHGMAEHARRYDNFATFLNKNGYIVFADDHRAHGMTSTKQSTKGVKGYHKGDIYADTVKDQVEITKYLKEKYNLPVVYFGHSYGSFIGQGYLEQEQQCSGVVLCGSANMDGIVTKAGSMLANVFYKVCGGEKEGKFMDKLSFGGFNSAFKKEGIPFAWLSRDREQVKKYMLDEQCGYVMSIAFFKYMMNGLKNIYKDENLAKLKSETPIALFSGANDPVGHKGKLVTKLYDLYKERGVKNLSIKLYDDARHEILNEINNDEVYRDMLARIDEMVK